MLHHLVGRDEWEGVGEGDYAPASLAHEGFIHLSTAAQLPRTAARFFAGRGDLLVVTVDEARLRAPLRFEPVDGDEFPHLYGPLNRDAVVDVRPWREWRDPAAPLVRPR